MLKFTICFIKRGNELLLLNRLKSPNMGLWNGVGGKIEPSETPMEGIIREIKEETGLSVSNVQEGGVVRWVSEEGQSGMYLFLCEIPAGTDYITPVERDEGILAWKNIDWVLDEQNYGVVDNMKCFLPHLLAGHYDAEHIFTYKENGIVNYDYLELAIKKAP